MPVVNGEARDMVPTPARGQGDRWERWGREALAGDDSNDTHSYQIFRVRLRYRAVLP
jgi:hypothetical protein